MTEPNPPGFDEKRAVIDILTALEYGTKKQETDILTTLLESYRLSPTVKHDLAKTLLSTPGFERFFLDVLKEVRPFAVMLTEIYDFLNSNEATVNRRASTFQIQSEKAKAELKFDLQNFPKKLLKFISEVTVFGSVVELRFFDIDLNDPTPQWRNTQAEREWVAISNRWDGDFYDDGFHRVMSYAHAVLSRGEPHHRERAEAIVRPLLDRVAAVRDFIANLIAPEESAAGQVENTSMTGETVSIPLSSPPVRSHVARDPRAAMYLAHPAWVSNFGSQAVKTIGSTLDNILAYLSISINIWDDTSFHRRGDDWWFKQKFGKAMGEVSPEEYLDLLNETARDYESKLDRVAPVVGQYNYKNTLENFLEFLLLPFWKRRWFLYELWTLTRVLNIAGRVSRVELLNLKQLDEDVLEWSLPGGTAQQPVAVIGDGTERVYCWTQRKTYHPGTKAGMEPDLRFTRSEPGYHDILIVENKDRLTAQTGYLREILGRYVGGTCAESIWLVNYETFPSSAEDLKGEWPGRSVHIASHFKPGSLPPDFEPEIESILRHHLPAATLAGLSAAAAEPPGREIQTSPEPSPLQVTLTWKGAPRDLDLHAWLINSSGTQHIYYGNRGEFGSPPYAELNDDQRQGDGEEIIRVKEARILVVAVRNFSGDAPLSGSGASVMFDGGTQRLRLDAPRHGTGRWWHVLKYDAGAGEVEVLHTLAESEPVI